jgi:hypothetical protein
LIPSLRHSLPQADPNFADLLFVGSATRTAQKISPSLQNVEKGIPFALAEVTWRRKRSNLPGSQKNLTTSLARGLRVLHLRQMQ